MVEIMEMLREWFSKFYPDIIAEFTHEEGQPYLELFLSSEVYNNAAIRQKMKNYLHGEGYFGVRIEISNVEYPNGEAERNNQGLGEDGERYSNRVHGVWEDPNRIRNYPSHQTQIPYSPSNGDRTYYLPETTMGGASHNN